MKALEKFVEQKNHWNSFFKGEQYEIRSAKWVALTGLDGFLTQK